MNLETAAQVGETLGGIAILLTMLFGLRQVVEWNQTRRNEITQRIAEHLGTTLVQRAMGVIANDLDEEFTQEEVLALSREQKNSINVDHTLDYDTNIPLTVGVGNVNTYNRILKLIFCWFQEAKVAV